MWCHFGATVPNLERYVTSTTRLNRTLDLCYGNIPEAYISKTHRHLGCSDHNVISIDKYSKQTKSRQKSSKYGTLSQLRNSEVALKSVIEMCFSKTVILIWTLISSYRIFCMDSVSPSKHNKLYPNNKPRIEKNLRIWLKNIRNWHFLMATDKR